MGVVVAEFTRQQVPRAAKAYLTKGQFLSVHAWCSVAGVNAICVAVVDDEAPVCTALGRLLRLADYEVTTFESGEAFLASLDVRRPACVLLDVHMPGLSGLDVHARLQAARIDVPVIFITASDDVSLDQIARQCCAQLLRKPFSNDALLVAVGTALQH